MMASAMKHHSALRALLIIGVPFLTTLLLLASAVVFHVPGASPFLFAHAAAGSTCATAPPDQQATACDGQDPAVQGCVDTARTLQSVGIVDTDGLTIGRIDRRYSTQCHSYWARIFDYRQPQPQNTFLALHIGRLTGFATNTHEFYSAMVYDYPRSPAPFIEGSLNANADGSFSIAATPDSATIPQGETPPPLPARGHAAT